MAGPAPDQPRRGIELTVWRKAHETYWDRQDARAGRYSGRVRDQYFDYLKPQETGNKVGVRWAALTDRQGRGLLAVGKQHLSVNALHHTADDLFYPTPIGNYYRYQMPERDTVSVNLDLHQRGLGGDTSWGRLPHDEFRLIKPPYKYGYRLRVLTGGEDLSTLAKENVE